VWHDSDLREAQRLRLDMRNLLQDVRYVIRQFYKSPGFVVGAIVSLMLGIGATTTVFSVVYGVLLTPFPYKDATRIAHVRVSHESSGFSELRVNGSQFEAIRNLSSVEDVFFQRQESATLTGDKYPIVLNAGFCSSNALDFLGVPPLLGRVFRPADAPGGNPALVAVLSYRFWREHYFNSREVIGQTIELDQVIYTVIGVMPPRFTWLDSDVYLPGAATADPHPFWMVFPKLKPGTSQHAAEAEFQALVGHFAKESLDSYQPTPHVNVVSLYDDALGSAGGTVANLFVAAVVLFDYCLRKCLDSVACARDGPTARACCTGVLGGRSRAAHPPVADGVGSTFRNRYDIRSLGGRVGCKRGAQDAAVRFGSERSRRPTESSRAVV
jgi:hypothetical protein